MRFAKPTLAVLSAVLLTAGCSNKDPGQNAEAQRRWADARATILAGVAQDQYKAHDFVKCRETLDKALAMSPRSATLHTLAGKLEIEQGHLESAELQLEMARTTAPSDPEPYYLSGVVYQRWQKPQTALEFYRQAGQRAPAELAYVLAEGEMLVILDRRNEALTLLQSKVGYFENSSSIRDAVAQLLVQNGKYDEAIKMFRQASVLAEDDNGIRERLATAYYYNKQYRESAVVLTRLTSVEPGSKRADLLELQGDCQLQINDPHGAARSFSAATDADPLSARGWQGLGRAVLQQGDAHRAELALRRAAGLDASSSQTQLLMGYAQMRQEDYPNALRSFKKAMSLDATDTTPICMVGYTLEKMGRTREAARYYGMALQLTPGDDMASELMAKIDVQSPN
jgi:Flp pilus assembly protein TadD